MKFFTQVTSSFVTVCDMSRSMYWMYRLRPYVRKIEKGDPLPFENAPEKLLVFLEVLFPESLELGRKVPHAAPLIRALHAEIHWRKLKGMWTLAKVERARIAN